MKAPDREKLSLQSRVEESLQETRVVLPGTQALLGFQLATFFTESFNTLIDAIKYLHLLSLSCIALSIIVLMSSVAYHQVTEKGKIVSKVFHRYTRKALLASLIFLELGLSIEIFIVAYITTDNMVISSLFGISTLLVSFFIWFGFTAIKRQQEQ